jgi:hypothetical protein
MSIEIHLRLLSIISHLILDVDWTGLWSLVSYDECSSVTDPTRFFVSNLAEKQGTIRYIRSQLWTSLPFVIVKLRTL